MSGKSINFGEKKINKSNFYKSKKLFNIEDIDINKILVSEKESYGTKNSLKSFIGYNDDDIIRPLFIKFSQMIDYVKHFDSNKTMFFKVISTVKWGHLAQTGSGFFKFLTTLKLLKTTKITISQKAPYFKITKK